MKKFNRKNGVRTDRHRFNAPPILFLSLVHRLYLTVYIGNAVIYD